LLEDVRREEQKKKKKKKNMHNNWTFFMTDLFTEGRIFYVKLSQLVEWKIGDILMWYHLQPKTPTLYLGQAYFHSIMEFGIIFWGVSVESKRIFLQQKRIIRIMSRSSTRTTCKILFRKLKILTLISQYILSLMRFLSFNLDIFKFNSSVHNINTRLRLKLHKPLVKLKMYKRSSSYNCINIYTSGVPIITA
jgi:hypothetical protein